MATTGRGMGTGRPQTGTWSKWATPGGVVYWTRSDDPGWGYLDDPDKEGLQPDSALRYPLSYIHFTWNGPERSETHAEKVGQQRREFTASALEGRICVPYGRVRVGGNVIAWRGQGALVWLSLAVSHGPIEGFVGVKMLEQVASLSGGAPFGANALFQTELGLPNPLGSEPTYYTNVTNGQGEERFPYLATAHCRFNLATGSPISELPRPMFVIDGRTLRDPRLGMDVNDIPNQPEVFSKNVALAYADYASSTIYGVGRPDNRFYWDSVAETADYCDVLVAGLPRHTINWAIFGPSNHRSILNTIRLLGRIKVFRRDGKLVMAPERSRARVHTFTPADSRPISATKVSMSEAYNMVKGTFTNPLKDYGDDTVWAKTEAARTGAEPPYILEVNLEALDNASEAQRQVDWILAEERNPLRFSFEGTQAEAQQYEPVDRIGYYSPTALLGVSEADPQDGAIVATQRLSRGGVIFHCKLYDESYFSDAVRDTESPPINTTAPPTDAPDPPTSPAGAASLTIGDGLTAYSDGRLAIEWAHPGSIYTLQYRVTAERSDGGGEIELSPDGTSTGPIYLDGTGEAITYTIRVRAFIESTGATSTALTGSSLLQADRAKTLVVVSDRQNITYDATGAVNPSSQTTVFTANKQNTTATVTWTMTRVDGTALTAATYLSATTGDSVTMTGANFNTARGSTEGVIVIGTLTDGVSISDSISIVRVQAGASVMTLVTNGTGAFIFSPNSIGKTSGTNGGWDAGVYSTQGYQRGAFVSFRPAQANRNLMVGLNTDPTADAGINSLDYAWYVKSDGTLTTYESAVLGGDFGAYTSATLLSITYDGSNIRYYKDGALQRTITRAIAGALSLDSSFFSVVATPQVLDLVFGPMGEQGLPAGTVLAAPNGMAAIGGRIVVGPSTKLTSDLTTAATSIIVESNVFASGDRVLLQKVLAGAQQTEYLAITGAATGTGPYTYTVTRNLDASGANAWLIDDPIVGLGQTGSHFIDLYSARGLKSASEVGPSIVGNVRDSSTWNAWTPRWAVGNLNGLYGYATNIFGAAFGIPTGAWIKIDPTNGIRIGHNATTKVQIDASGSATYSGALSAATGTFAGSLSAATGSFSGSITVGSGNDIAKMDPADATYRLWIGHATAASAPFRVTKAGAVTATSGTIGGWSIGADSLIAGGISLESIAGVGYISIGTGSYNNSGTPFYVDGTGLFSLGTALTWDGTDLGIAALELWVSAATVLRRDVTDSYFEIDTSETFGVLVSSDAKINGNFQVSGDVDVDGDVSIPNPAKGIYIGGNKVLGAQGAAVANATDAASAITQLNALLARARAHGWIAT